jgi:hypothetical protein
MQSCRPLVVIEWLALLLRIREFPRSNLGPETGFTNWSVRGVPQSLQEMPGLHIKLIHYHFLPRPFQFIIHLSPFSSITNSVSYCESVIKYAADYGS